MRNGGVDFLQAHGAMLAVRRLGRACGLHQPGVDVVGDDHAVVHRAQPARHDDAHAAGVIQAADLLGNGPADGQAFELGAEAGPVQVLGVVLERQRRGGLGVVQPLANVGHVAGDRVAASSRPGRCLLAS